MNSVTADDMNKLFIPRSDSHKGQNGRLLIIGGSHLFHAASLWALEVASRIVDLVHYSSVVENNAIVAELKKEFRNGIVVPRADLESYIEEDDCILIGPGMVRAEGEESGINNDELTITNLKELEKIKDEGLQTAALTNYLLAKYPQKQWVIDAGALQMVDSNLIPKNAILTPHQGEFEGLIQRDAFIANENLDPSSVTNASIPSLKSLRVSEAGQNFAGSTGQSLSIASNTVQVQKYTKRHRCILLLKGKIDIACSPTECRQIVGGNVGMTKGGTGDVLAGLIAALACKNDPFLATCAGSYINKAAGDALYKSVGPYFNASDLSKQIPRTMSQLRKLEP